MDTEDQERATLARFAARIQDEGAAAYADGDEVYMFPRPEPWHKTHWVYGWFKARFDDRNRAKEVAHAYLVREWLSFPFAWSGGRGSGAAAAAGAGGGRVTVLQVLEQLFPEEHPLSPKTLINWADPQSVTLDGTHYTLPSLAAMRVVVEGNR